MKLINAYETPGAVEFLWNLLVERSVEDDPNVNISHRALPVYEDHVAFFRSRPFVHWYLIRVESEEWAGYVSLTPRNEIGIVLLRGFRGHGVGPKALKLFIDMVDPLPGIPSKTAGHFVANINPGNARSIHTFEKLGFKHIQNTYTLEE